MNDRTAGGGAAMPSRGYTRPKQIDTTGLRVTHIDESTLEKTEFDFSGLDCPPELLRSLVLGFATAVGPDGRWRTTASARAGSDSLGLFIRSIVKSPDAPQSISELGPEIWWSWRAEVESRVRWPGNINQMRVLLKDTPGVPDTTLKALKARAKKPKTRLYEAYSRDEFHRIRSTASAIVREGQRRIDANTLILERYRDGREPADAPTVRLRGTLWTAGEILDHLARTGAMPAGSSGGRSAQCRALICADGSTTLNESLFPNSTEMLSACLLLTCARGYSTSVLNRLTVSTDRADDGADEDPVHVIHLDKPRRGPSVRYSDESLGGPDGKLLERATALTRQARRTVEGLGHPTDSLVLFRQHQHYRGIAEGLFAVELTNVNALFQRWHARAGLVAEDGSPLRVTMQRLRLTEQVLNEKPRQNSPAVSETIYRRPDPQTREAAAAAIIRGQVEAVEHARATVRMRTLSDSEIDQARQDPSALADELGVAPEKVRLLLSGALNTATGACLDFAHAPGEDSAGGPCTASFLSCLGCANAVATPAHLPRLAVLEAALERVGSAVTTAVWEEDYAAHYARLRDLLLSNTTPEQRQAALSAATPADTAAIDRLLTRGLDA